MTYISRKTRIIVSRWLDECDAEYRLRASRKRSDGRLKTHNSCDDLRAWANNNCIKHEHFVDLMSEGEFPESSKIRLYGRFIPVPDLVKLLQSTNAVNSENKENADSGTNQKGTSKELSGKVSGGHSTGVTNKSRPNELDGRSQDSSLDKNSSVLRLECEKYILEKSLFEGMTLLCKAVRKLENIDNIVCVANIETENMKNEEIEEGFVETKTDCSCSRGSDLSGSVGRSKSFLKTQKEMTKCTELLRKISCLRLKLKKIQECRHEINEQIKMSQRTVKCSSSAQVTELYSRRERAHIKRLQKQLERLISERGKVLSQMCKALSSLNNLKKASRMNVWEKVTKGSKCALNEDGYQCGGFEESGVCPCGCPCMDNYETSESEKNRHSDYFTSEESTMNLCIGIGKLTKNNSCQTVCTYTVEVEGGNCLKNRDSDKLDEEEKRQADVKRIEFAMPSIQTSSREQQQPKAAGSKYSKSDLQSQKMTPKKGDEKTGATGSKETSSKQKPKFVCPGSGCKKINSYENLASFQNSTDSQQQTFAYETVVNLLPKRPDTSPPTGTRNPEKSENSKNKLESMPEREIKSETTMMEIEKALRNYEQRLKGMDSLHYKIRKIKDKLSEGNRLRMEWKKQWEEVKRLRENDREKSKKEIAKLCAENWELKKQVCQMKEGFEIQRKKIQSMRWKKEKEKELAYEAEELKKELAEYQESFQDQRKCITKLESVVFVQRSEIEKLMDHIRNLTKMKESMNVQRSRSYSPDVARGKRILVRPKNQVGRNAGPPNEENAYTMDRARDGELDMRKKNQMHCCSPQLTRRMAW